MPGKRKLNGVGPDTRPKTINCVTLTPEEWLEVDRLMDELDATKGYVAATLIRDGLKRRRRRA